MPYNYIEDLIAEANLDDIQAYLSKNPDAVKESTSFDVSPLMLSCYYNKPEITRLLLNFNTDIDFFEACVINKFDVVANHIFNRPEIVNEYYHNGYTGLGLAAYFGNEEIARYLVLKDAEVNLPSNNAYGVFPLHSAAAGNFTAIAKMLIENKAEVNIAQASGITPLHSAAQHGNIELIIMLLEKGATVDIRMEGGKLPADLAYDNGFVEIAEILAI